MRALGPSLRHALHHNAVQQGLLCMDGHACLRKTDVPAEENGMEVEAVVIWATCPGL